VLGVLCISLLGCHWDSKDADIVAPVAEGMSLPIAEGGAINIKHHSYVVHRGDTLYAIAWALGVDYRDLAYANHLKSPYALHQGQSVDIKTNRSRHSHPHPVLASARVKPTVYVKKSVVLSAKLRKGKWYWPARGQVNRPRGFKASGESGIDIVGHWGTPVKASAGGEVVYSGKGIRGYGNLIIVKHSDDLLSAYGYNAKRLVKTGDHVSADQKIALMGRSPFGKPCLHFEIRRNGRPSNPMHYLKGAYHLLG